MSLRTFGNYKIRRLARNAAGQRDPAVAYCGDRADALVGVSDEPFVADLHLGLTLERGAGVLNAVAGVCQLDDVCEYLLSVAVRADPRRGRARLLAADAVIAALARMPMLGRARLWPRKAALQFRLKQPQGVAENVERWRGVEANVVFPPLKNLTSVNDALRVVAGGCHVSVSLVKAGETGESLNNTIVSET